MKPLSRNRLLFFAFLLTLAAAWFAPTKEKDAIVLSNRAKTLSSKPQGKAESVVSKATVKTEPQVLTIRPRLREATDDSRLFNSTSWTPPPKPVILVAQPAVVPTKPPAPLPEVAPPIPFRVLGRYEDAGETTVFVQFNEQNLAIKVGDTVAGKYKVESITANNVGLLYVPLNQPQSLSMLEQPAVRPRAAPLPQTLPQPLPQPMQQPMQQPTPQSALPPAPQPLAAPLPVPGTPGEPRVAPTPRPRIVPLLPKPLPMNQPQVLPPDTDKTAPLNQPPSLPNGGPN
jgi:hypothetical protein